MIEIDEVEIHFALASRGDFDQPAAQGQTLQSAGEHDAADKIENDVRALSAGRAATSAGKSFAPMINFSAMA